MSKLAATFVILFVSFLPASKTTGLARPRAESQLRLSPAQQEVWNEEENAFRYMNGKDPDRYVALWDEQFVGWPDYEDLPVGKQVLARGVKDEFARPSAPVPLPTPLAVAVFGDVAITYYFWPDAEKTSPRKSRVTHTWRRTKTGWKIIGGLSGDPPCHDKVAITRELE